MNIQYIKSNIAKMTQQDLTSLLSDMILDNVLRLEDFNPGKTYNLSDRVYFEEGTTHYAYECIKNGVTGPFNKENWIPLVEVYRGPAPTFYTLRIREEVHIFTNETLKRYTMKMDFDVENSSIAIYEGMNRLIYGVDYEMDKSKNITFKSTMQVGKRIIIEVRERLGVKPNIVAGIVLYDIENNPYNVLISDTGEITVNRIDRKNEAHDVKRATLLFGDKRYTLMVDGGLQPPALGLFEEVKQYIKTTNGKVYSVTATKNTMRVIPEPYIENGTEFIMGTDKKFYKFNVDSGNNLLAVLYNEPSLKPEDFNVGFRLKSTDFKDKMIDVKNGQVRLIDYLPNTAYKNILLRDKVTKRTLRLTMNSDLYLELHDDVQGSGTHSPVMDELYFYDYNLDNRKLYISDSRLIYETCPETIVRDSRGINMITDDGVLTKMIVVANDKVDTIKFADLSRAGTFASPLDEGLVVMDNGVKKIINVNLNGDRLVIGNASNEAIFKTNDHYIFGSDNKLYKLTYSQGSVGVSICDPNEFVMENKRAKLVIKCNDVINIVDVKNNSINIIPVSTFTHTLKSDSGQKFILEVSGDRGREELTFKQITSDHPYYNTVGLGYLYIKNSAGQCYKGVVSGGKLVFSEVPFDPLIDYNITSVANTNRGWFKFEMTGNALSMRKIHNNLYFPTLCYEVSRDFVMSSENDVKFSLTANGNGDLVIKPVEERNVKGIFLRSDDDRVYCIGVLNNSVISYRSYIEKSVKIDKLRYMRDVVTGKFVMIYMKEDKLTLELIPNAPSTAVRELDVYNEYGDKFYMVCSNGQLTLVEDILDRVVDKAGNKYKVRIQKRKLLFTKDTEDTSKLNNGHIKLTDMITKVHYNYYVDGAVLKGENNGSAHKSPTQAIRTEDGKLFILSLFDGRISMTEVTNIGIKSASVTEDYLPNTLEAKNIYDGIKLYRDVINTEGYIMNNRYDLVMNNGITIHDVDEKSDRFNYVIPEVTRERPKVNIIDTNPIK